LGQVQAAAAKAASGELPADQPTVAISIKKRDVEVKPISGDPGSSDSTPRPGVFTPGTTILDRYEIIKILGEGGMGAVYKAVDREFDRHIALKVIRPELASDSGILTRFKQEVLLARQITHRNIVRLYDLVSADNVKFITMEFVEGEDLKTIIQKGALTTQESVKILIQICEGLEAAHAEKVVHRDLKPQNIMVDPNGRVAVMDFGLAHSTDDTGLTKTGMLVGTPDYMSPEQALGMRVDHRSDIFSLGLIFYEMITGELPFKNESMIGTLVARTRERAPSANEIRKDLDANLNSVLNRCLDPDPNARYQSVSEILMDLRAFHHGAPLPSLTGIQPVSQPSFFPQPAPPAPPPPKTRRALLVGGGAGLVASVAAGWYFFGRKTGVVLNGDKPIKVLVADFTNDTGDSVFDRTLESMLGVALEGASFVTVANREQARRQAKEIRPEAKSLDEQVARLVAVREGYDVVVSGSVERKGAGYALSARITDSVTGNLIGTFQENAPGKNALLNSVGKLAEPIRRSLGDTNTGTDKLMAGETFTAGSLQAAHLYARAQEAQVSGNAEQAMELYQQALSSDPDFGRAYAGLAVINRNLGRREEAEKNFNLAVSKLDRMTERERLRTQGAYAIFKGDMEKGIEALSELVKRYPADTAGHVNLSLAYTNVRNIPKAIEEAQQASDIYPKIAVYRNNLATLQVFAGKFTQAQREAEAALQSNPSYVKAHTTRAVALVAGGQPEAAKEAYERLKTVSKVGASVAAMGLADIDLAQGHSLDAIRELEEAIRADLQADAKVPASAKGILLGFAYVAQGDKGRAIASLDRAVAENKDENLLSLAGSWYIKAGDLSKAEAILKRISAGQDSLAQARASRLRGEIAAARKDYTDALKEINSSIGLVDTWMSHAARAEVYKASGDLGRAITDWEVCINRQGEGALLLMDDLPTYAVVPPIYFDMGKAQAELKRSAAQQTLEKFVSIRARSNDAMTTEARKLLGK
jgi:tetratricopeptide (TPR) repeat protein